MFEMFYIFVLFDINMILNKETFKKKREKNPGKLLEAELMFWSYGEGKGYGCGTSCLPCSGGAPGREEAGVVRTEASEGLSSPHNFMRYVCFSGCCCSND